MKKVMILAFLAFGVCPAIAQKIKESEVPQVVKTAFMKAYPSAKGVKWDKEAEGFEASFEQNKNDMSVVLDKMGIVKEVETGIAKDKLPKAILEILKKDFADHDIEETAMIVANNVTTYEVEVEKGKKSWDLIFDSTGKLLKKIDKGDEIEKD